MSVVNLPYWPDTPSMMSIMRTQRLTVLRKQHNGTSNLGTELYAWGVAGQIIGRIESRSGVLRMSEPGTVAYGQYMMYTPWRLSADGFPVVRPRDILIDPVGKTYLVRFVTDDGDAHVQLSADIEQGTMNSLQQIAEQG